MEVLSKFAAGAGSGDSAGEACETKDGGGADSASVHCRTFVTELPKRFQKEFWATQAHKFWRTGPARRRMTGLWVKTVSAPLIPSTSESEIVALGPSTLVSTAASAQQSPSAAASSLPSQVFNVIRNQSAQVSLTDLVVICLLYFPEIGVHQGTICSACPSCLRMSIKWLGREKIQGASA